MKAWRKGIAEEVGVQIYKWLSDKVLEAIVEAAPKTPDDLLNIKGLGPASVEKYGPEILEILGVEEEDGVHVPGSGGVKWKKDTHFPLSEDLRPFVIDEDRYFSPLRQRASAWMRKHEHNRKKSLEEMLRKKFTRPGGFQIGGTMIRSLVALMPRDRSELEGVADMSPIVIDKYGDDICYTCSLYRPESEISPSWPVERPPSIVKGMDILILAAKLSDRDSELHDESGVLKKEALPSYCWKAWEGDPAECDPKDEDDRYFCVLRNAVEFIDSCLCLEDQEGKPRLKYGQVGCFISVGISMPEGFKEFDYLEIPDFTPSYWEDAARYSGLWEPRHRVMEDE